MAEYHIPVLLKEALDYLNIQPGKKYIDCTLGGGGHSLEIIKRGGQLLALDVDPDAIGQVQEKMQNSGLKSNKATLVNENFAQLKDVAEKNGFGKADGILFDLGVSTHQLETPKRGFSFNLDGLLDMRMDPRLIVTAKELVNVLNEGELYDLFTKFGEEHYSRPIARAICSARRIRLITTCDELAKIVLSVRKRGPKDRTHPATRVFQALRIIVNDELNNLKQGLGDAIQILNKDGRVAVISFHSLEDRIVKNFFKEQQSLGILEIKTKKPIIPTDEEIEQNSRSRSGKLRVAQKQ